MNEANEEAVQIYLFLDKSFQITNSYAINEALPG